MRDLPPREQACTQDEAARALAVRFSVDCRTAVHAHVAEYHPPSAFRIAASDACSLASAAVARVSLAAFSSCEPGPVTIWNTVSIRARTATFRISFMIDLSSGLARTRLRTTRKPEAAGRGLRLTSTEIVKTPRPTRPR